uniref:F-box domain-containing protein n=1 Tax=Mycena chlorophos TaxID=658473 RepID=A0ABQ0LQI6_MYCCL|nr:predicted protein [Mycena chlorophos]
MDLPGEILMLVFAWACAPTYLVHQSTALALSQVCTRWRQLSLSMPELWTAFAVKLPQPIPDTVLLLHLERSHPIPLSLDVDLAEPEANLPILALLLEHATRWADAKLPLTRHTLPLLCDARFKLLRTLHLRLETTIGYHDDLTALDTPQLHELTLACALPEKLPIPNAHLTSLHLGAAATMDLILFMERYTWPVLQSLSLNPFYQFKIAARPLRPFPHLRKLSLAMRDKYSRNPIIDVLNILTLPALTELELWGLRDIPLPPQAFASFIMRSGCSVSSLRVTFRENIPHFVSSLRVLGPSLQHLAIFGLGTEAMGPTTSLLQALIVSAGAENETLLPHLTSLEIQAPSFIPTVLDMVVSRVGPNKSASCVHFERLESRNAAPPEYTRRISALKEQGVVVLWPPRYRPLKSQIFIQ